MLKPRCRILVKVSKPATVSIKPIRNGTIHEENSGMEVEGFGFVVGVLVGVEVDVGS